MSGVTDTLVGCTVCGRTQPVGFGSCLSSGWPKCCGYTMRLMRTEADIEAVTHRALSDQLGVLSSLDRREGEGRR